MSSALSQGCSVPLDQPPLALQFLPQGRYWTYFAAKICLPSLSTEYRATASFFSAQSINPAHR
jgi:hypothetical protein